MASDARPRRTATRLAAFAALSLSAGTALAQSPSLYALAHGAEPPLDCSASATVPCELDKLAVDPGATGDMDYRYVPLCPDGSGDHEWTLDAATGQPPTCRPKRYVRCVDGTRPIYWYDGAVGVDGLDLEVDRWVFFHKGGANCSVRPGFGLALGDSCGVQYFQLGGASEMGSSTQPARRSEGGILSADPARSAFAGYNRVYPWKCSFDKYTGNARYDTANGPPIQRGDCNPDTAGADSCRLWFHGRPLWQAMLRDLQTNNPDLPDLGYSGAPAVVLSGNSNGASGLTFNLDGLAERIRRIAPEAQVFGVLDNHFNPALEAEAAFANDLDSSGFTDVIEADASGITPYDYIDATTSDYFPAGVDSTEFERGGELWSQLSTWWSRRGRGDASCARHHRGMDRWRCFDEEHVLFNHVTTPVFVHQTLRDVALRDKAVDWFPALDWDLAHWKPRVLLRIAHWIDGPPAVTCAEPRDPHGPGVFVRDAESHVNLIEPVEFFRQCLQTTVPPILTFSYHDAVLDWVETGAEVIAIEHPFFAGTHEATGVICP